MKASLFAEDEEEKDMFQDYGATKLSSPRLIFPGSQSRPSGRKPFTMCLYFSCSLVSYFVHTRFRLFFDLVCNTVQNSNSCFFLFQWHFSVSLQWAVSFRLVLPLASSLSCRTLLTILLWANGQQSWQCSPRCLLCCHPMLQNLLSRQLVHGGWGDPSQSNTLSPKGWSVFMSCIGCICG